MQSTPVRDSRPMAAAVPLAAAALLLLLASACSDPFEASSRMVSADASSLPAELRDQYHEDAARMALRLLAVDGPLEDQPVAIPRSLHRDLFRALVHVHNAHDLPARDTIVHVIPMSTFPDINVHRISLGFDETAGWPRDWRDGVASTEKASLDRLIALFSLEMTSFHDRGGTRTSAWLAAPEPINTLALAQRFRGHEGIRYAESSGAEGTSIDIQATRAAPWGWVLEYSIPWHNHTWRRCGGFERSCNRLRTWSFRVDHDGTVTYLGAAGDEIPWNL